MLFGIEFLPVITATLVLLAIGVVWFAPQVFGAVWVQALKLDRSLLQLEAPGEPRRLLIAGVLLFAVVAALHELAILATAHGVAPLKLSFVVCVPVLGVLLLHGLQVRHSLAVSCISATYSALVIIVGMGIVAYWPW